MSLHVFSLVIFGLIVSQCVMINSEQNYDARRYFGLLAMFMFFFVGMIYLVSLTLMLCIIQKNFKKELERERFHLIVC